MLGVDRSSALRWNAIHFPRVVQNRNLFPLLHSPPLFIFNFSALVCSLCSSFDFTSHSQSHFNASTATTSADDMCANLFSLPFFISSLVNVLNVPLHFAPPSSKATFNSNKFFQWFLALLSLKHTFHWTQLSWFVSQKFLSSKNKLQQQWNLSQLFVRSERASAELKKCLTNKISHYTWHLVEKAKFSFHNHTPRITLYNIEFSSGSSFGTVYEDENKKSIVAWKRRDVKSLKTVDSVWETAVRFSFCSRRYYFGCQLLSFWLRNRVSCCRQQQILLFVRK